MAMKTNCCTHCHSDIYRHDGPEYGDTWYHNETYSIFCDEKALPLHEIFNKDRTTTDRGVYTRAKPLVDIEDDLVQEAILGAYQT